MPLEICLQELFFFHVASNIDSQVVCKYASLFSKPFLSRTFSLTLNQMHVVVFSESVSYVENLLYPADISFSAFYVLYSVCWSPVDPQDIQTSK